MRKSRHRSGPDPLLVALLFLLVAGGFLGLYFWEQHDLSREIQVAEPETEPMRVYYGDGWYELRDDLDCYLFMGLDQYSAEATDEESYINDQQADFLLLMIVDHADQSFYALHINRDTMAEIDRLGLDGTRLGRVQGQLALAHTFGSGRTDSCRNELRAVSRFLYDTPINHYFSMTMDGIPVLNDLVGGVTVYIEDDFSGSDAALVQGTEHLLKGDEALTFVRARGSIRNDKSNLNRMNRQRVYMNALYEQLRAALKQDEHFAARLGVSLAEYSISDLTTDQLAALADKMKDYHFKGIEVIAGEAVVGEEFMEFYADEEALQAQVIRLFYQKEA